MNNTGKTINHIQKSCIVWLMGLFMIMQSCSIFDPVVRNPDLSQMTNQKVWVLASPDQQLRLEIVLGKESIVVGEQVQEDRLLYRLLYKNRTMVEWSQLGIETNRESYAYNLEYVAEKRFGTKNDYKLAHGKTSHIKNESKNLDIILKNKNNKEIIVRFQIQNDGAAFAYQFKEAAQSSNDLVVQKELSSFRFPKNRTAWMQEYQEASKVSPAYEYFYNRVQVGKDHEGKRTIRSIFNPLVEFSGLVIFGSDGWAMPALVESQPGAFVLLSEAGLDENYAGTHLENDGSVYKIVFPAKEEGLGLGDVRPHIEAGSWQTPWRVMITGSMNEVFASNLITDLSKPLDASFNGKNPDWVKPGKVAWDWWSYLATGDWERQKKYVDAAQEFGWEYVLVDANWNRWPDAWDKIKELVEYAKKKRIGIFLWYNSGGPNNRVTEEPRDRMHIAEIRNKEFARLNQLGVKGVKIDFWQSDKQITIQQYFDVMRAAAKYKLMVNLHGSTIPRGWRRQFPNLMTLEAVKGAEWYRFPVFRGPNANDNIYYALTRNVVGPMDYTPVVFNAAFEDQKISYAHSLALAVVFESALTHFADNSDKQSEGYRLLFGKYPFVKTLLAKLPVHWDESRLLQGHPDSHLVIARRKGRQWYIAGLNAKSQALSITIDLKQAEPALFKSHTNWTIIEEGSHPGELNEKTIDIQNGKIELLLPARSGFMMYDKKVN